MLENTGFNHPQAKKRPETRKTVTLSEKRSENPEISEFSEFSTKNGQIAENGPQNPKKAEKRSKTASNRLFRPDFRFTATEPTYVET
jgi:hypothetical protein